MARACQASRAATATSPMNRAAAELNSLALSKGSVKYSVKTMTVTATARSSGTRSTRRLARLVASARLTTVLASARRASRYPCR